MKLFTITGRTYQTYPRTPRPATLEPKHRRQDCKKLWLGSLHVDERKPSEPLHLRVTFPTRRYYRETNASFGDVFGDSLPRSGA